MWEYFTQNNNINNCKIVYSFSIYLFILRPIFFDTMSRAEHDPIQSSIGPSLGPDRSGLTTVQSIFRSWAYKRKTSVSK